MRPTLPLLVFFYLIFPLQGQNFDSACAQQQHIFVMLQKTHYSPPNLAGEARTEVLDLFVKEADEKNLFFMESDVQTMQKMALDVRGTNYYCAVIEHSFWLIQQRLHQLDSISTHFGSKDLHLDGRDTINFIFRPVNRHFFNSLPELQHRVQKRIKYETLKRLSRSSSQYLKGLSTTPDKQQTEQAGRQAITKFNNSLNRYRDQNQLIIHLADCMSNALARRCDPHSSYLNVTDMKRYKNALSTHENSFGFSVKENRNGELVIGELIPGGPAWKSNDLNEEDIVATIEFRGSEELTADDLSEEELNWQLNNNASDEISLTVIKKDLQVKSVPLKRERIASVGNTLNSYVVYRNNKKMGYIPIPSFYLSEEEDSREGCANDVAKEIIELKADSVQGIIIDLRYNGGGSMREAIALAGIFINEGPVAIYRHRGEEPFFLKDMHRGTIWDGPLLILINSASASASEFVAAALQDYDRAVIAGSQSFGKGTAQNLLPADSNIFYPDFSPRPETAYLKVTGGKFYRLNATSHQGKGIVPDITIPGVIEKVMEREASYPYFLPCDSLSRKATFNALSGLPRQELRQRNKMRQAESLRFKKITALGDSLLSVSQLTEKVPLSYEGFKTYSERQKNLNNYMQDLFADTDSSIVIRNNSANERIARMSDFQLRSSEKVMKQLARDITFHESVYVMNDMIELVTDKQ